MNDAANVVDIKSSILSRAKALGNSNRSIKNVCSDLINQYGTDSHSLDVIADGTFLNKQTILRMAELKESASGKDYQPQSDTLERILKFFNAEVYFRTTNISPRYQNKAKKE